MEAGTREEMPAQTPLVQGCPSQHMDGLERTKALLRLQTVLLLQFPSIFLQGFGCHLLLCRPSAGPLALPHQAPSGYARHNLRFLLLKLELLLFVPCATLKCPLIWLCGVPPGLAAAPCHSCRWPPRYGPDCRREGVFLGRRRRRQAGALQQNVSALAWAWVVEAARRAGDPNPTWRSPAPPHLSSTQLLGMVGQAFPSNLLGVDLACDFLPC